MSADQWGQKAIGRKTTGTGRMRYLKDMPRRFKNGFQEVRRGWRQGGGHGKGRRRQAGTTRRCALISSKALANTDFCIAACCAQGTEAKKQTA